MTGRQPKIAALTFLVGAMAAIYMISHFLRNSVGVIAPDIAAELSLVPEQLGLLSGAFFFSFAAAQLPLGIALDRFGPSRVMAWLAGLTVIACIAFAMAGELSGLVTARILMGLGCSSFFMAPLVIYARVFPPEKFSTLTGIQLGFGSMGTLAATAPLAWMAGALGWRQAFFLVAAAAAGAGLIVLIAARDSVTGHARSKHKAETLRAGIAGLDRVIRQKDVLRLLIMHAAGYPVFATLLGLWGGPYLSDIHGADLQSRGNILFIMAGAQIIGLFVWGPVDRLMNSRQIPVMLGAGITVLLLAVLAAFPQMPLAVLYAIFALYGFASAYTPVLTAHGRSLFPGSLTGRGLTFLNIGSMGGVFILQTITGLIIGLFPQSGGSNSPEAYQACFAFLALFLLGAMIIYSRASDIRPSP